jgi:DNA polymerase-3 subunit gamma/tau
MWQLLLKGLGEVHSAPIPLEAAEMAVLRAIYAADLPDPGTVARQGGAETPAQPGAPAAPKADEQGPLLKAPADFAALVQAIGQGGKAQLAQQLHDYVGLVRYAPPELVIRPAKRLAGDFLRELGAALKALTGTQWQVSASDGEAVASLLDREKEAADRLRADVLETPIVKAAFEAFPDAELAGFKIEEQRSA